MRRRKGELRVLILPLIEAHPRITAETVWIKLTAAGHAIELRHVQQACAGAKKAGELAVVGEVWHNTPTGGSVRVNLYARTVRTEKPQRYTNVLGEFW